MKTRILTIALVASTTLLSLPGSADQPATVEAKVQKVEVKSGKARATMKFDPSTQQQRAAMNNALPGDKGFFLKDGAKVADSDFEIDRIDEDFAYATTGFPSGEELKAKTSSVVRITAAHTCPRGGARPEYASKDMREGKTPAAGFSFANVTATEKVHKTKMAFTIDKGSDDGVMLTSAGYAPGTPELPYAVGYVGITWISAKTAGGVVDAHDVDDSIKRVKRIAFEKLSCK